MISETLIRVASPEDIPLIRELAESTWWPAYRDILSAEQIRYMLDVLYSARALREQMEAGHHFLLAYESASENGTARNGYPLDESRNVLGFASWSAIPGAGTCKLHKIYVLPGTQGKGTGRFLLNFIEKKARETGSKTLELNVNRFNKARSFYEKLGFSVHGTADIPIGPFFMNDYIMHKNL